MIKQTRLRVCLIDDDALVRDAIALSLGDADFDIVTAASAAEGLQAASTAPFDAIVTDFNMPGVSGAQFIADARARWPNVAILVITGASVIGGRDADVFARECGADGALIKPFRARELTAAIHAAVAQRRG